MKTSLALLLLVSLSPAESAVETIDTQMIVIRDKNATWDAKWDAYKAMAAVKDKSDASKAAYKAVQKEIAAAVRRESVPTSGILMGLFGAALLWGGLGYCIRLARKSGKGMGAEE